MTHELQLDVRGRSSVAWARPAHVFGLTSGYEGHGRAARATGFARRDDLAVAVSWLDPSEYLRMT